MTPQKAAVQASVRLSKDCILGMCQHAWQQHSIPDPSTRESVENISLPRLFNITQDQVVVGCESHWELISLNHTPEGLLEVALQAAILDEDAICQPAVALLLPPQEVFELPLGQWPATAARASSHSKQSQTTAVS